MEKLKAYISSLNVPAASIKRALDHVALINTREELYMYLYDEQNTAEFDAAKTFLQHENNFLENPFIVVDGVNECRKCGSKKVYCYQKQTRSCDEPSTTFYTCIVCKQKWIYN